MAVWQIMKGGKPTTRALFDDGGAAAPGDEDTETFTAAVKAFVASLGPNQADGYNYVGLSPPPPAND